jgi:hypothetical protein
MPRVAVWSQRGAVWLVVLLLGGGLIPPQLLAHQPFPPLDYALPAHPTECNSECRSETLASGCVPSYVYPTNYAVASTYGLRNTPMRSMASCPSGSTGAKSWKM